MHLISSMKLGAARDEAFLSIGLLVDCDSFMAFMLACARSLDTGVNSIIYSKIQWLNKEFLI